RSGRRTGAWGRRGPRSASRPPGRAARPGRSAGSGGPGAGSGSGRPGPRSAHRSAGSWSRWRNGPGPSRPSAWRLPSTRVRPRTRYGTGYGDVRTTLPSRGAERPRVASALEAREGGAAGVDRGVVEDLLDAQQLVVLGDALGAGRGAGL